MGCSGRLLTNRAVVFPGRISYGLYVFHMAALYVAEKLVQPSFRRPAFGFALTVAASVLSYYVLEAPFLRLKERFTHVRSRPVEAAPAAPERGAAPAGGSPHSP
jgi:peptidoglycan/LPS O-acetylase OafA/YrhL